MAMYSFEFKTKIVAEYLNGKIGSTTLAKKYGIKSETQICQCIHNYKEFGDEGLKRSRKKESYLSNKVSYKELALANGISSYSMLSMWVGTFRVTGKRDSIEKIQIRK